VMGDSSLAALLVLDTGMTWVRSLKFLLHVSN
jgi:hypothetical protein